MAGGEMMYQNYTPGGGYDQPSQNNSQIYEQQDGQMIMIQGMDG